MLGVFYLDNFVGFFFGSQWHHCKRQWWQ